jgi:DNA-binding transcriptional MocR family regulator
MQRSLFSQRMQNIRASEIRELLKVTEQPEIISFAGGLPAPELFPARELAALTEEILLKQGTRALQYSTTEGYTPLRKKICERMQKVLNATVNLEETLITCGSQQALDFIGKAFLDKGDEVLMESPSYLGAINAFRAYEPKFVEVATDHEGMIPEALEEALKNARRPKFIYVVPDFQNPTGRTWSLARREALVRLTEKYEVLIVEDNPYGELRFEGEQIPAVKSLDTHGRVLYLGTFSKTLCPGMRIGWIAAAHHLIEPLVLIKQGADLHSSTLSQMQINLFMERYNLDDHIQSIREVYRRRRDTLIDAMEQRFDDNIRFTRPSGGLFSWIELPEGRDSRVLLEKAIGQKVAFVPGGSFYPCAPKHNTLRLNFSNMPEHRIVEGVERLEMLLNT